MPSMILWPFSGETSGEIETTTLLYPLSSKTISFPFTKPKMKRRPKIKSLSLFAIFGPYHFPRSLLKRTEALSFSGLSTFFSISIDCNLLSYADSEIKKIFNYSAAFRGRMSSLVYLTETLIIRQKEMAILQFLN